jgi:multifunctional methyltransferase subunit TRM112
MASFVTYMLLLLLISQNDSCRTQNGYPLKIEATQIVIEESPIDRDLVVRLRPKLEYLTLLDAARQLSGSCDEPLLELPAELGEELDDATILALHMIMFDVHVMEGNLVCPDTGRKFPINDGIPNMILHEDEV